MRISFHQLIPIIRELLRTGQKIRLRVAGSSMYPFIKDGDVIEIEEPRSCPRRGDVLLVRVCEDNYVIHRVVKVDGEYFYLRGDAQQGLQGPFRQRDVVGRVLAIYRDGRRYVLERGFLRIMSLLWTYITPSRKVSIVLAKVIDRVLTFLLRS